MAAKFEPPKLGLPTVFDPSFKGVGQKVGLEIWRVEQLKVIKKPPNENCYQGQFHEGDAYIVLQTKQKGNALERHIFFWLGKDSSQDEQGVAAYKTVELDTSLGGEPVQHREVQAHESDEFLSLFPNGVRYLEGGVATGFKHVDRDAFETRLLHIKGRRNIRVAQVPLDPNSMNSGDVFILDKGRSLFIWNGKESSKIERIKAMDVTKQIRDQERSGNATVHVCEEGNKEEEKVFWDAFGKPKPTRMKTAGDGGDDAAHSRVAEESIVLQKISDATGSLKIDEITEKPLKKELLDTNDAFILDTGADSGIFVWVGKGATQTEKLHSMKYATDYLGKKGYPNHTKITRVVEGGETAIFKQFFTAWPEKDASKPGVAGSKSKAPVRRSFDAKSLHQKATREQEQLVDDGSGQIEIWRIENFEMVPWPKDKYGEFYGGDCYIILYTYLVNSKKCYIIYFWQGLTSSQDEKGSSAIWAKTLDDKYGGEPVQVRVVQNKEPPHLYLLFKGKMVIHSGGKASGFKNLNDKDSYDTDGTRLFQVRGTSTLNTRAIQVPERAASLNSGDVFILESPKGVWLWCGNQCSGDERETAKNLAPKIVKREYSIIMEGKEPADFWASIGGKAEYGAVKEELDRPIKDARLFQCSNARGHFYVEEIFDFDQEDLIEEDVMILDTYYEVFVWIGNGANTEEKKGALETALEYVKSDTSGRTVDDTCIIMLKQGFEPTNFTCHFMAWNPDKWSQGKSYEELKKELEAQKGTGASASLTTNVAKELEKFSSNVKYTFAQLTAATVPEGVDATQKEQYLIDDEFKQRFGMTKAEYNAQPQWKRNNLKKKVGLY